MQMKSLMRLGVLALAVMLVGGVVVANGAAPKKVNTKVSIKGAGGSPPTAVKGKVRAKRHGNTVRKCVKKRTVIVKHAGEKVGRDKTNRKGKYRVPVDTYSEPGNYKAIAKKKTKKHGKIVCLKGRSRTITLP
jgi:hypothetical protein